MSNYVKPQSPIYNRKTDTYFYPLTTADQVIMQGGYRLDQIVGKVEKSTITLYANGWSAEAPYSYSVTVKGLDDNVNMKMLPHFPEDFEGKQAMKEETTKISFASRNGSILTFECWDEVPIIDIPVDIEIDITYPGVPDIKINYSVVGGTEEPANPTENMIWVNTDQEIADYILSKNEPKNPIQGMVWICLDNTSNICFYTLDINGREFDEVHLLSAKQYVGSEWVDVKAKSFQGGVWVDWWNGELFDNGNQFESITGGWWQNPNLNNGGYSNTGTLTIGETIHAAPSTNKSAIATTKNKIDFEGYETLVIEVDSTNEGEVYIHTFDSGNVASNFIYGNAITETGLFRIDLSSATESAYISICAASTSTGTRHLTVPKIWME